MTARPSVLTPEEAAAIVFEVLGPSTKGAPMDAEVLAWVAAIEAAFEPMTEQWLRGALKSAESAAGWQLAHEALRIRPWGKAARTLATLESADADDGEWWAYGKMLTVGGRLIRFRVRAPGWTH